MLREIHRSTRLRARPFQPEKSALLVIDMQEYFLNPESPAYLPASPAIIPRVTALIDAFGAAGRPIYFSRHVDHAESNNALWRWWQRRVIETDRLSQLSRELDVSRGKVIMKHEYDAFHHTDLDIQLKQQQISQVVICGVMTNLCCESTARAAFVNDFDVYFAADATATVNAGLHRASLLTLAHGFAAVTTAASLRESIRVAHDS